MADFGIGHLAYCILKQDLGCSGKRHPPCLGQDLTYPPMSLAWPSTTLSPLERG